MFGINKCNNLTKELKRMDSEIESTLGRMDKVRGTLITPKYNHMYSIILQKIDSLNKEMTDLTAEMRKNHLETAFERRNGIIDVSGLDEKYVNKLMRISKELHELFKQGEFIQNKSDINKHNQLRADGFRVAELQRKKNELIRKCMKVKLFKK